MCGKRKTMTCRFRHVLGVVAVFAAASMSTAAHAFDWYGGASAGQNSFEVTGGDFFPFQTFSGTADGYDTAWKAFLGMRLFEKYVSAEFGYNYLGKSNVSGTVSGSPASGHSKTDAYTASLVGMIPIGSKFGMLIRMGFSAPEAQITTTKAGVTTTQYTSDLKFYGGLGAQFDFTDKFSARFEYERFNQGSLGPSYANVMSLGFTYLFYTDE